MAVKPPEAVELPSGLVSAPPPRPAVTPAQARAIANQAPPEFVNHEAFGDILKKFVTKSGWVDYRALKADSEARELLKNYIADLIALNPSSLADPRDRLAAWLNLYNALVIQEILKVYPVTSLLKIRDWFGAKRLKVGDKEYSLIEIEEEIFRKELNDSRTVLSRVNASSSGPRMLREPFQAKKVDEQLDERALSFIRDPANLRYDPHRKMLTVSQLFMWYEKDFPDLPAFLAAYLDQLPQRFYWEFTGYDYQLNDAKLH